MPLINSSMFLCPVLRLMEQNSFQRFRLASQYKQLLTELKSQAPLPEHNSHQRLLAELNNSHIYADKQVSKHGSTREITGLGGAPSTPIPIHDAWAAPPPPFALATLNGRTSVNAAAASSRAAYNGSGASSGVATAVHTPVFGALNSGSSPLHPFAVTNHTNHHNGATTIKIATAPVVPPLPLPPPLLIHQTPSIGPSSPSVPISISPAPLSPPLSPYSPPVPPNTALARRSTNTIGVTVSGTLPPAAAAQLTGGHSSLATPSSVPSSPMHTAQVNVRPVPPIGGATFFLTNA
jgi:hypothetical protein